MTIHEPDTGARCETHVGEAFPPRCADCDAAARDATTTSTPNLERRVRSHDPETSWDAAAITAPDANEVRSKVLAIVAARGPIGDEQIFAMYRAGGGTRTAQRVRTARAELSRPLAGDPLIREHDRHGITTTGAAARRWVIA
ncbi:hypothetical protein [Leifsonia sp. P73]|uniref:hypothetical protein n=1 Tax=Leifsonia sp. P73 TaxID=3423959 RepID=UPI003DA54DD9